MDALSREMIRLIQANLQVGDVAPTYTIKLKRPTEFHLPPKELTIPDGALVSFDISISEEFGCSSANVTIENCYGLKSPEFAVAKHINDSSIIKNTQHNRVQLEYYNYLVPETWIQICAGYGWSAVPILTGAIDVSNINSNDATVQLSIRDNMRYLVDQNIDSMIHGRQLSYPRTDNLVIISDQDPDTSNKVSMLKVINTLHYLNVRTGPGTGYPSIGKLYNGNLVQYVDEVINEYGNKWYKILFNGEERWIFHEYAELLNTSATIKSRPIVKVDKIKNIDGNHVHVRSGPGVSYMEIGTMEYGDYTGYIKTEYVNAVPWFNINYGSTNGWICGLYSSVIESNSPAQNVADFKNHLHVKANPSTESETIGYIYDGNGYEFIETTQDENELYWHKIKFMGEDGLVKQGWVDDELSSFEQETTVISSHTLAEIVNVTTHLNVRSGPSTSYPVIFRVYNGQKFPYLDSKGDGTSIWHHILYTGKDGKNHEGFVFGKYVKVGPGHKNDYSNNIDKQDSDILVDMTAMTNPLNNKWTASAIVHDLAVQAVTIGGNGGPYLLDRKICDVWTSEYTITDKETQQPSRYVINEANFPYTMNYFDAAMQIVNQMGDMSFKCNRYGDIMLFRNKKWLTLEDPDWEVKDYVDLTEASLQYDVQNMRGRVLVISDNGSTLFEHKGIAYANCKGVNRQFAIKVPFADTLEKRKEVARSAFQQILSNWRVMSIAVPGNPLMEIGDIVRIYDMVTTATSLFRIKEIRHNFSAEGFITQLDLVWAAVVGAGEVSLLSEEIPNYAKRFKYDLKFTGASKPMKFKFPSTIYGATVRLKDPITNEVLANISIKGNTSLSDSSNPTAPTKYIKLVKNGVNVRNSPDLNDTSIKKVRSNGFTMKFLAEVGNFYKGIDNEDGQEAYIWKAYCTTYEQNGNTSTNLLDSGDVGTFISLVESKIGCGYTYGTDGEILTEQKLRQLESFFGYSHYHKGNKGDDDYYNAEDWIGHQVFDCSGLIVWALRQMGLISSSSDYSAAGLFKDICYEVSKNDVQPGDLFFRQGQGGIYHVGVVVNGGYVVEARGTRYGVITRQLPRAEKFGRIKKLSNTTTFDITQIDGSTPVQIDVTPVPISYSITTTFNESVPQVVTDKVKLLSGNLLFYKGDCVLYYIGVESDGGEKNSLVLKWAPMISTPINLDLIYDVLIY